MRELPVFQCFREVYAGVFSHFLQLLRIAWLPLTLWLLASGITNWWLLNNMPVGYTPEEIAAISQGNIDLSVMERVQAEYADIMPTMYALFFLNYLLWTIAAVGFHRFVLLGESVRGWSKTGFVFGKPELLYIWSLVKIGLIVFFVSIPFAILAAIVAAVVAGDGLQSAQVGGSGVNLGMALIFAVIVLGWLVIVPRLLLVLPHVALGNRSEIRAIWRHTKGNGLRLAGYFLLVLLSAAIASSIVLIPANILLGIEMFPSLETILMLRENPSVMVVQFIVGIPVWLVWTMLSITMLSVAYREIVGLPAAPAEA